MAIFGHSAQEVVCDVDIGEEMRACWCCCVVVAAAQKVVVVA